MLVYKEVPFMVTSRILDGRRVGKAWRFVRKWLKSSEWQFN